MNYKETLNWMFAQLPMYQRQGASAFKKDLTNIILFSDLLQNPQEKFRSIHIAGTNGKGSTSHMLASVLQEAGYKTGLYTSPHLKDFRERIRVNGVPIPKKEVVRFINENRNFLEKQKLVFFEMTVGMAFEHFAKEKVGVAVIEVGLGGRLDSTNIIRPILSVITNIGLDHTQFLGETLPEIAFEKAGIIKDGIPVVISQKQVETSPVFLKKARENNAPLYFAEDSEYPVYELDLKGIYQQKNIKRSSKEPESDERKMDFQIDDKNIQDGLRQVVKNTGLKGRWQVLRQSPKVICDTAHNRDGLEVVLSQLAMENYSRLHIVLGFVNDKELSKILPLFPKDARYYFCKPRHTKGA
ncbi:MAG: Mur ligase family protein [Flavobacteriaceae bacterium]|nr:Mur ligase family protein [Flavobacteriaceae bacterium]